MILCQEQIFSQLVIVKVLQQLKNDVLELCNRISNVIDCVDYMFILEFDVEVDEFEFVIL